MNCFFSLNTTQEKIDGLDQAIELALKGVLPVPEVFARDPQVVVLPPKLHPPKEGFSQLAGVARMLHDLASIELQAMELAVRTLAEFPEAPENFQTQLAEIARDEGRHLRACLNTLAELGFAWGHWPVHTLLVDAVAREDELLDRIVIVHRYLEGGGLDAGDQLARRMAGVPHHGGAKEVLAMITREEVGHVHFGSQWYHNILKSMGSDPVEDLRTRLIKIGSRLPKRVEKLNHERRRQAGFLPSELVILEKLRQWQMQGSKEPLKVALTQYKDGER